MDNAQFESFRALGRRIAAALERIADKLEDEPRVHIEPAGCDSINDWTPTAHEYGPFYGESIAKILSVQNHVDPSIQNKEKP